MTKIERDDIYIISQHSNLTKQGVDKALKEKVYNDKAAWQKFLQIFLISLGIGFTVSGIVFFFAYNWADLHKSAKIGITQALIITSTILVLVLKVNENLKNIILTASAMLVGVLFAVYGQIYQTGANAYDFFLVWTIFITLWVMVSNFAPLWLLYILLINTTFIFYVQQVASDWSGILVLTILLLLNTIVLISAILLSKFKHFNIPNWFITIMTLAAATFATVAIITIIFGIFAGDQPIFPILISIVLILFSTGIWYGIKTQSGLFLSVIPFSLIVIVSAILIKISDGEMMFLLVGLFIIISVTLVIKNLINLQKQVKNEQ